jgi:K+/H+ antiporter YhaU regulatory subunit KhtT
VNQTKITVMRYTITNLKPGTTPNSLIADLTPSFGKTISVTLVENNTTVVAYLEKETLLPLLGDNTLSQFQNGDTIIIENAIPKP